MNVGECSVLTTQAMLANTQGFVLLPDPGEAHTHPHIHIQILTHVGEGMSFVLFCKLTVAAESHLMESGELREQFINESDNA